MLQHIDDITDVSASDQDRFYFIKEVIGAAIASSKIFNSLYLLSPSFPSKQVLLDCIECCSKSNGIIVLKFMLTLIIALIDQNEINVKRVVEFDDIVNFKSAIDEKFAEFERKHGEILHLEQQYYELLTNTKGSPSQDKIDLLGELEYEISKMNIHDYMSNNIDSASKYCVVVDGICHLFECENEASIYSERVQIQKNDDESNPYIACHVIPLSEFLL